METNNNMSTKQAILMMIAGLLITFGSLIVFSALSSNLSTGFVDMSGLGNRC